MTKTILVALAIVTFCGFVGLNESWSTPTGLNNIPTADVAPFNVLVLQQFSTYADEKSPVHFLGVKFGVADFELGGFAQGMEVGVDGQFGPTTKPRVATAGQAKYRLELIKGTTAAGIGIANITGEKHQDLFPYAVLSHDFGSFRFHGGYKWPTDDQGGFWGIDVPLKKLLGHDITLRTDLIHIQDRRHVLGSMGFIAALPWNFLLEAWGSFPSDGDTRSFTLKFDYVIDFPKLFGR